MEYKINPTPLASDPTDPKTGLSKNSNGGSELMYRALMAGLDPALTNQFQFISSRIRELDPIRKKILILNDMWNDPESSSLKNPAVRDQFAQLVFVSNYQFNSYNQGLGVPFENSLIMRNAIKPIPLHEKPKGKVNLIYHTTPHRGLELLIPVFLEIVKIRPNIHLDVYSSFDIYGWPQRNAPYEGLFDVCRMHPNITYHGSVTNDRIREALRKAHVFAYPSIWPETSCIAAIEAMSAGCAVIAPDYAALPETLGHFGLTYRWTENVPDHMQKFANLLVEVIDNVQGSGLQRHLTNQIAYANTHYNMKNRLAEWTNLLTRLSK